MKFLFTASYFTLLPHLFSFSLHNHPNKINKIIKDSIPAVHITDGLINEWPMDAFHSDNDTTVFTAIANDDNVLYAALTIPEFSIQNKLMRNGMKLFIDLKEKKKTGHGVEFPIGEEVTNFIKSSLPGFTGTGTGQQGQRKEVDKKLMRQTMSLGMVSMKIFGLTAADEEQGLKVPGSINIAFKWDANDEMHIEYSIPLKLLNIQPGDKKEFDVGWTINGMQRPQMSGTDESNNSSGGDFHGGSGGHGYGRMGGGGGDHGGRGFSGSSERPQRSFSEMTKEQTYWTKYTMVDGKKAF